MTVPVVIGIAALGGVGAVARFLLDSSIAGSLGREFPYGTLLVNLLGCFVLGLLVGATVNGNGYRLFGTGLIGAFTTFSTWTLESHRLGEEGRLRVGTLNFAVSLVLGVTTVWLGRRLGAQL